MQSNSKKLSAPLKEILCLSGRDTNDEHSGHTIDINRPFLNEEMLELVKLCEY